MCLKRESIFTTNFWRMDMPGMKKKGVMKKKRPMGMKGGTMAKKGVMKKKPGGMKRGKAVKKGVMRKKKK